MQDNDICNAKESLTKTSVLVNVDQERSKNNDSKTIVVKEEEKTELELFSKRKARKILKKEEGSEKRKKNRVKRSQSHRYVVLNTVCCDCYKDYVEISGKTTNGDEFETLLRIGNFKKIIEESFYPNIDLSWDWSDMVDLFIELIVLKIRIGFDDERDPERITESHKKRLRSAINRVNYERFDNGIDDDYVFIPLSEKEKEIRKNLRLDFYKDCLC
jgi:hypothetical protein